MTIQFNESVTDDELRKLPLLQFQGKVFLVDSMQKFKQAIVDIDRPLLMGFDTETKPSFKKGRRHNVSLLQLADLLADENIIKTGVAIRDDIKALQSLTPFEPGGFIDLQSIVAGHGIKQMGLKKLSAIILGYSISKSQQVSNWEAPALTEAQQLYAATDAWVCKRIYQALNGKEKH